MNWFFLNTCCWQTRKKRAVTSARTVVLTGGLLIGLVGMLASLTSLSVVAASSYNYSNYNTAASNQPSGPQPIIRWYRYYNTNGQPSLSSTITDQHLRYGYEALDRNMQVIRRVGPYSTETYARQKAKRDAEEARRQSDMNLRRSYGSAAQAITKRNQMLADMASRKKYLQSQLLTLQRQLSADIALAATFERQRKPVPLSIQTNIDSNKKNVLDAEQNIAAINLRQQQVTQQYDEIIRRLNGL